MASKQPRKPRNSTDNLLATVAASAVDNGSPLNGGDAPCVKIGLCGFTVAIADYPQLFPMVEVQQTFYQPFASSVLERWRRSVPAEFEFTIKAWQLITHTATSPTYRRLRRPLTAAERVDAGGFRNTKIVNEAWQTTVDCARILKATAILFQCPRSFRPTDENVAALNLFFRTIERPSGVNLLWEPRGPWPADLLTSICTAHRLVHVVDPFVTATVTAGITYYRLHGISGSRHVYTDDELIGLRDHLPQSGITYVLFNNIPRADDARRFAAILARPIGGADLPARESSSDD